MRGLLRKSVIFFKNINYDNLPWFPSPTPPAMMAFVRLEILAEGRPIRLGAPAFKVQMALIEASGRWSARDEILTRGATTKDPPDLIRAAHTDQADELTPSTRTGGQPHPGSRSRVMTLPAL